MSAPTPTSAAPTGDASEARPRDRGRAPIPVPDWLRPVFRIGGALFAAVALVFSSSQVVFALAHEEETLVDEVDAAGLTGLQVDNEAGPVYVVGNPDAEVVTITARVSDGMRDTAHDHRVEGGTLVLDGSCPLFGSTFCEVRWTVEIPTDLDVRVRAEDRISVSDIDGDVDVDADNGRIEVARLGGDLRVDADNGRIVGTEVRSATAEVRSDNGSVNLEFVEAPRAVVASSDNGSVEVVVPDDAEILYAVDASTDNGSSSTQVLQDPASDRTVDLYSDNGNVTIRYPT